MLGNIMLTFNDGLLIGMGIGLVIAACLVWVAMEDYPPESEEGLSAPRR